MLGLGLAGVAALVVASLLVGRLAPTPAVTWLIWLHHRPHSRAFGLGLQVLGLATLSWAWWLLGGLVRGAADGVETTVRAACLWSAPLLVVPPMFSNDVWSYVADGMIAGRHASPYLVTPSALRGPILHAVSARWLETPAPYGPLPLWWGGVAAQWTSSPWIQLAAFRLLALIGLALLATAVAGLARATGRDPAMALWLVLASPFTLVNGVLSAHLDVLVAGLTAAAVLAAVRGRLTAAAALVGVAASVKFPALVVCLPVALAGLPASATVRQKMSRTALVSVAAASVVWILGVWSDVGVGWIHGLAAPLSSHTPLSLTSDISILVAKLGGRSLRGVTTYVGPTILAFLAFVLVHRRRSGTTTTVVTSAAILTVADLVVSPVVHLWYFFGCLPFLASGVWTAARTRRATVAFTLVMGLLTADDLSLHLPFGGLILVLGMAAASLTLLGGHPKLSLPHRRDGAATLPRSPAWPPPGEDPTDSGDRDD